VHLKKIKINKEYAREEYARRMATLTPGFSGADIANICNEAAIIAARTSLDSVGIKQFEEAVERVIGGIEKKTLISPEERRTVAYHESGHAVVGWFLEHSNPLVKITIIPRSKGSLGFAQYLPDELSLYSKEQLMDMISTALGGRVSEELFFGKITTGASDDIKKITQIAQSLVTVYGMSKRMGLRSYQQEDNQLKAYSEATSEIIDEEVKRVVDDCYAITKKILLEKQHLIKA
jgi:AFG3 family protein